MTYQPQFATINGIGYRFALYEANDGTQDIEVSVPGKAYPEYRYTRKNNYPWQPVWDNDDDYIRAELSRIWDARSR